MSAETQANRRHWDADATRYHAEHPEYLSGFYWCPEMLSEKEAQLLGDVRGRSILEIGCGSAPCSAWLAEHAADENTFVTGFDISGAMLARRPGTAAELPLVQADVLAIPYRGGVFDTAFSAFGALPFVADLDAALAEIARVLKPGGRFVFSVTHPMRWVFPDDPEALHAEISYFERAYVEVDDNGRLSYAEFHRTFGDWVRALRSAGFELEDVLEPEWPEGLATTWGQWSRKRGELFPGTAIFICRLR
ncbi:class I SAM-dependent methyltransferase [Corynebacterium sp. Q4381]|uniref:class I SAM-dependent methyltransferase n=1 Tax=Corynebacterium sp. Marseille-Q4381 TaxID=3121597 RepID=UPI002FE5D8E3